VCLLALSVAKQLSIAKRTGVSISVRWMFPAGYFEGFLITAVPLSARAITHNGTVYGKNSVHLPLRFLAVCTLYMHR